MSYQTGDTVVYPRHGAARIVGFEDRVLKGVPTRYVKLEILSSDGLVILVPAANLEKVGVRDVVDAKAVSKVFGILRTPIEEEKTNWSRRYKLNVEKIATGDVNKIAEVVRDLAQRDDESHGLSAGEKRMLLKARDVLASEIALSEDVTEEGAQHLLDVNLGYAEPTEDDLKHHSQTPEEPASKTLERLDAERAAVKKASKKTTRKKKAAAK